MTPLKFTSDAEWLRELSRLEVPFGSAGQPREIREKAERFEEIADKLEGYASKLGEVQKYWDDEKRRYDAADKAFRLVCDERDALQSRLGAIRTWFEDRRAALFSDQIEDLERLLSGVVEKRRDLFSELKEGLESIHVERHERIGYCIEPECTERVELAGKLYCRAHAYMALSE